MIGNTQINQFSEGNYNYGTGTGFAAAGSYSPIMGASYYTQRGTWRVGTTIESGTEITQNDSRGIVTNPGMNGYIDDGIGHTMATATALALSGTTINYSLAQGVITPSSTASNPTGVSNYTSDFFAFHSGGGSLSITVNDGSEFLSPGTADPGVTLRSTLEILDASGDVLGTGTEDASTLFETYTGNLAPGNYYLEVNSHGGYAQTLSGTAGTYTTTNYYEMGSYFITGSGVGLAPEPGSLSLMLTAGGLGGILWLVRARKLACLNIRVRADR